VLALRDANLIDRCRVDHRIFVLDGGGDRLQVGEIALDYLATRLGQGLTLLAVSDQAKDLVAALAELRRDPPADEAGAASQKGLDVLTLPRRSLAAAYPVKI
jgi:hypothetical protein